MRRFIWAALLLGVLSAGEMSASAHGFGCPRSGHAEIHRRMRAHHWRLRECVCRASLTRVETRRLRRDLREVERLRISLAWREGRLARGEVGFLFREMDAPGRGIHRARRD